MRTSPWLVALYTVVIVIGFLIAMPNVLPQSVLSKIPSWLPHSQVSLGLDLRGGSYLVLEVDEKDLTNGRLQSLQQDARRVLRDKNIQTRSIIRNGDQIVVTLTDPSQSSDAVTQLRTLANTITSGLSAGQSDLNITPNGATIAMSFSQAGISANVDSAVQQSLEVIRKRVDQVGVAEPTIQRVGPNRVLVQLPGAQDPSHLRELLGSTAKMSFHLLADNADPNNPPPGVTIMRSHDGDAGRRIVWIGIVGEQVEGHLRGRAEKLAQMRGILRTRKLDENAVRSDALNGRLGNAHLVDALADDFKALLDGGIDVGRNTCLREGHRDRRAIRRDVEIGLTG